MPGGAPKKDGSPAVSWGPLAEISLMYCGYEVYKLHDKEIKRTKPFWEEIADMMGTLRSAAASVAVDLGGNLYTIGGWEEDPNAPDVYSVDECYTHTRGLRTKFNPVYDQMHRELNGVSCARAIARVIARRARRALSNFECRFCVRPLLAVTLHVAIAAS